MQTSLQIALFARLRMLVRNTNVVAFTILHPDINGETLFRYGDCVIALQPWQGITPPDEFSDTAGLLRVIHLPAHLSLYTPKKSIFIYGVKRSMHSLHLSELRIPPMGCKEYSGCDDLFWCVCYIMGYDMTQIESNPSIPVRKSNRIHRNPQSPESALYYLSIA